VGAATDGQAAQLVDEQVEELAALYPNVQAAAEGGVTFYLLPNLAMPAGCTPTAVDTLLCPTPRDGYMSRLFTAAQVTGGPTRNWNGSVRLFERTWVAVSWQTRAGLRLAQMVSAHLDAFRPR
jgi:hypothetical protein